MWIVDFHVKNLWIGMWRKNYPHFEACYPQDIHMEIHKFSTDYFKCLQVFTELVGFSTPPTTTTNYLN